MANDPTLSIYTLADTAEFNDYLGQVAGPAEVEVRKVRVLNRAWEDVERFLDRRLVARRASDAAAGAYTSIVEYHTQREGPCDARELRLSEYPVIAVASVYEDTSWESLAYASWYASDTLLTANDDYTLISSSREPAVQGILYRIGSTWPTTRRAVKVTYTAGYANTAAVPGPIKEVFLELCALRWRDVVKEERGVMSRSDASGSVTRLAPAVLTPMMQERLAPYRRMDFAPTWESA